MKIIQEANMWLVDNTTGFRSCGFIEGEIATLASYIVEVKDFERPASIHIVVGAWGDSSNPDQRVGIYAKFYYGNEYGFVFSDPTPPQISACKKTASRVLKRSEILVSKDLQLYTEILDMIYVKELRDAVI